MNKVPQIYDNFSNVLTIANGQTVSGQVDLASQILVGILWPSAMTSATATLQTSSTLGGTYGDVQKDEIGGGAYTITVVAGKYSPITNLAITSGLRYLQITGASAEGGARTITLVTRPVL